MCQRGKEKRHFSNNRINIKTHQNHKTFEYPTAILVIWKLQKHKMKPLQMHICINKDLVVCDRKKHTHTHTPNRLNIIFRYRMLCARSPLLDMSLDLTSQKMSAISAWDVNMTVAFMVVSVFVSLNLCCPHHVCTSVESCITAKNVPTQNITDPILF